MTMSEKIKKSLLVSIKVNYHFQKIYRREETKKIQLQREKNGSVLSSVDICYYALPW